MKSEKNILRDIFRAQGYYVHGDIPEPNLEAIRVLSEYRYLIWREGYYDSQYDSEFNS